MSGNPAVTLQIVDFEDPRAARLRDLLTDELPPGTLPKKSLVFPKQRRKRSPCHRKISSPTSWYLIP
jgi:hypothetical protein